MKTVLLVIDVQRSLLDEQPWSVETLLKNVQQLVGQARLNGVPVVFVRDTRVEPDGSLDASLEVLSGDLEIEKDFCDSFLYTRLHQWLQKKSIERLIICGMQTDYCIDTTCRKAASLGYVVALVQDAHTTFDHEHLCAEKIIAHHNRILQRFTAGAGSIVTIPLDSVIFA